MLLDIERDLSVPTVALLYRLLGRHLSQRRLVQALPLDAAIERRRLRLAPRECVGCGVTYAPQNAVGGRPSRYCSRSCRRSQRAYS